MKTNHPKIAEHGMNFEKARFNMVEQQIRPWDVLDFDILDALSDIPREHFVSENLHGLAYADQALPLPNGSSMLEPKIVARLIQGLALKAREKVLEVGTGSGYATAVLCKMCGGNVVTIDIDAEQQARAKQALDGLGLDSVTYQIGDGLAGEAGGEPFDAIYIGGGVPEAPEVLKNQLAEGGRMVVIVGSAPVQRALLITRKGGNFTEQVLFDTLVPNLRSKAVRSANLFNF